MSFEEIVGRKKMPIESESRSIPNNVGIRCPQCGQIGRKVDVTKDIYECPNCTLQFEALIEITWDSKHYSKKPLAIFSGEY